jgi:hypothetical protein
MKMEMKMKMTKIKMKIKSTLQIFFILFLSKFTVSLNLEINNPIDQNNFNPFNNFLNFDKIANTMMSKILNK